MPTQSPDAYQLASLIDVLRELAAGEWESMTINQQEARELVAAIDRAPTEPGQEAR